MAPERRAAWRRSRSAAARPANCPRIQPGRSPSASDSEGGQTPGIKKIATIACCRNWLGTLCSSIHSVAFNAECQIGTSHLVWGKILRDVEIPAGTTTPAASWRSCRTRELSSTLRRPGRSGLVSAGGWQHSGGRVQSRQTPHRQPTGQNCAADQGDEPPGAQLHAKCPPACQWQFPGRRGILAAVREYDPAGKLVREIKVKFAPYSAVRLDDGQTVTCGQQSIRPVAVGQISRPRFV